jgi:hypothetical protein
MGRPEKTDSMVKTGQTICAGYFIAGQTALAGRRTKKEERENVE